MFCAKDLTCPAVMFLVDSAVKNTGVDLRFFKKAGGGGEILLNTNEYNSPKAYSLLRRFLSTQIRVY